jgi:alpha-galactosidase
MYHLTCPNRKVFTFFLFICVSLSACADSQLLQSDTTSTHTVYLSTLDLTKMTAGWGQPQPDKSIQSNPLTIVGRTFERGVGSHANSVMYIDLKKTAKRFTAFVGVDDEVKDAPATIKFRIFGDGKQLFNSGIMKAGQVPEKVDIDLAGISTLVLIVNNAGDNVNYDHADWADAKIEFTGPEPVAVDPPKDEPVILTPKPAPAPGINGPKVYGARPGNPFIYRIPATGTRPMKFSAENLPASLKLDSETGIITGSTPSKFGDYIITLKARNNSGKDQRSFKIIVGDVLALTPPMGWNSWYIHYHRVTEADMRAAADVMIASGMADYGYQYVNIDDCWMVKPNSEDPMHGGLPRDEDGRINTNAKFPNIKAMTDYIHSKGLKAGLYTSPGPFTCAGYVGSYQHELIDAQTFAEWGFDFLKYDWCSYGQIAKDSSLEEFKRPYQLMGDILKNLDRDIVLNLCQYGMGQVWTWGGQVGGHCWRTTGDLGLSPSFYDIGLSNAQHYQYAKPGQWNDPDYILIGYVGSAYKMGEGQPTSLTPNEQYSYMSMWSLMAAPLFFSGDMAKLDEFTLNILCNAEVIQVNQDPLGKQARIISQTEDFFIMLKDLEDGSKALGLFNTTEIEIPISVTFSDLKINGKHKARDLWRQKNIDTFEDSFESKVPRHGVMFVRLFPSGKAK